MKNCNALLVDDRDNVCVLNKTVAAGEKVCFCRGKDLIEVTALEDIPMYFKMAVYSIKKGTAVIKYGTKIGLATADIPTGGMVHTHNLTS